MKPKVEISNQYVLQNANAKNIIILLELPSMTE